MISLSFLYWIAGMFFVLIISGVTYLVINRARRLEEPENEPIVHNFLLSHCPFREGILKDMKTSENRIKIEMFPRDINYLRAVNDKEYRDILRKYTLFFDKRQVEIQTGDASPNRTIIKAYPSDINLLPESLKNTSEGKAIMNKIQKNNMLKDESELMENRMDNLNKIANQTFGAEIYTSYVKKTKEQMKDLSENVKKEEKKFGEK